MAHGGHEHHIQMFKTRFWINLVLTIPVLLLSDFIQKLTLGQVLHIPFAPWIQGAIGVFMYTYGGFPFTKGALDELKSLRPGMMTLISLAITVAFVYSVVSLFIPNVTPFFWELATLLDVMLLGHWIEMRSVSSASSALEELAKLLPDEAHKLDGDDVKSVSVNDLKKGDTVLVKPGESIPADGKIVKGESEVNESLVSGESKPVAKGKGDEVVGGSINGNSSIHVKITGAGEESFLNSVIELVEKAQESKSDRQLFADKAAAFIFYLALGISIAAFVFWASFTGLETGLSRAVGVLVIACPHALGLAIPLAASIATSRMASEGVIIRNREAFEAASELKAVIFDKTGTLTTGELSVDDTYFPEDEDENLRIAASAEKGSEHGYAAAILSHTKEKGVSPLDPDSFEAVSGKGVKASVDGKEVLIGKMDFAAENAGEEFLSHSEEWGNAGKTVIALNVDGSVKGLFAVGDTIREDSYDAVSSLKNMGIKVILLSGDSEDVSRDVSDELGIDEYFAEVLPDEKEDKVKRVMEEEGTTAMVGDGINDAPSLATADIGIAIGAGTDVAVESSDIVLSENNPSKMGRIIDFSGNTGSKMVQNLWWAAGYNVVAMPLAAGLAKPLGIVITPAFGAAVMSLSTVIVALNAQLLRKA
ncbi:copper-translocating P-type ATPase [Limisalsivibrio acetivorans]|uniref:copper-translocating P-type ATPase n=1 Tax=Limisalsivibrio acetivorans TaxID=1304888 RepID=UPI0003B410B3|nr:copper-translocating P-type ATPase [Limisalsivibrio acetivorans]